MDSQYTHRSPVSTAENEKKYILVIDENFTEIDGHKVFRVQAIKDFGDVKKGDLGGFIEREENLSHNGACWVYHNACVYGNARVFDDATVRNNARVFDEACVYWNAQIGRRALVYGKAKVFGYACVMGSVKVFDNAVVCGDAQVCNNAIVSQSAQVCEQACVVDFAFVHGEAKIIDRAIIDGSAEVCGNAIIGGLTNLKGEVFVGGNVLLCNSITLDGSAYIQKQTDLLIISPLPYMDKVGGLDRTQQDYSVVVYKDRSRKLMISQYLIFTLPLEVFQQRLRVKDFRGQLQPFVCLDEEHYKIYEMICEMAKLHIR